MIRLDGLNRFRCDPRGVAAIEFAIIAPLLIALLLGAVTLFDLYRASQIAEKATFTIGDILSRKSEITSNELDINRALYVSLARNISANTTFRLTSIKRQDNKFTVCWSYAPSPMAAMVTSTIPSAKMPIVANGDSVLFLETTVRVKPLFGTIGLPITTLSNFSAARPRFAAAVKNTSVPTAPC